MICLSGNQSLFSADPFQLLKATSRCSGTSDKLGFRGFVKSAAVCAAICQGKSKWFAYARHKMPNGRSMWQKDCQQTANQLECKCFCEITEVKKNQVAPIECNVVANELYDVYQFSGN